MSTLRAISHFSLQFPSALLQTSFLQDYGVSIVIIANFLIQPYNKDDYFPHSHLSF